MESNIGAEGLEKKDLAKTARLQILLSLSLLLLTTFSGAFIFLKWQ